MSKVPNWGFSGPYRIDFIGMPFRTKTFNLTGKKSPEINSQILKTAQLTSNARPGHLWEPDARSL
jgi:hypothetical protein